jgi:hypothetical protein
MKRTAVLFLLLACPTALGAQAPQSTPSDRPAPETAPQNAADTAEIATATESKNTKVGPPDIRPTQRSKPRVFGGSRVRNGQRTNGIGVQLPF